MADAADSKSATRKGVKVRLLSPAPAFHRTYWIRAETAGAAATLFAAPTIRTVWDSETRVWNFSTVRHTNIR